MASNCAARVPSPRRAPRRVWAGPWVSVRPAKCGASCRYLCGKVKQIVGSTLWDSSNDGMELVTNFESDKSLAEFYKEDELLGDLEDIVIMFGADPASQAVALEALRAYP
ncbi:hypothetical protein BDA96_03G048600, partial [Sorghum bicolor]